jgi:protein associated with RNAse G/E
VEYLTEKWGGRAHKRGAVELLGRDQHGSWLWGEAGRRIELAEGGSFVTEQDALTLIPEDAWWTCAWWMGHPDVELYVDICTPSRWEGDRITHIDLDLDVIRFRDGRVEIVDRDEFEANLTAYGYPDEIIEGARDAAHQLLDLICRNASPFDGSATDEWIRKARAL